MLDIVIPNNNEKSFVSIAEKLGYKELIFLYGFDTYLEKQKNPIKNTKIKISYGILADPRNILKINNKFKEKRPFTAIKSSPHNREIIEKSSPDLVFSLEEHTKKDFMHQRGSGLNHIMCKLMHDNNIAIGFSLSSILNSEKKHLILGRIIQNIKLCRKYKVKTIIASFTEKSFEMRSPHDAKSLFLKLGMDQKEAKDSLNNTLSAK